MFAGKPIGTVAKKKNAKAKKRGKAQRCANII